MRTRSGLQLRLRRGCWCPEMARQGLNKPHKVISSGRLAGSVKGPVGKRRVPGRRESEASVDSGYSLYSTDSEDQVTTIHKGLDRCAALLQGILQKEKADVKPANSKPGKAAASKPQSKVTFGKGVNGKRKQQRRTVPIPQVQKAAAAAAAAATVMKPSLYPGLEDNRCLSTVQAPVAQPVLVPIAQGSLEAQLDLSEDVQTQMSLLSCPVPGNRIPTQPAHKGPQTATVFNSRLTTSTPTLSPPHSGNPFYIQTNLSNDMNCQVTSQGGVAHFLQPMRPVTAVSTVQPVSLPLLVQPLTALAETVAQSIPQPPCNSETGGVGRSPHESLKDQALLRQIHMHLEHRQQEPSTQHIASQTPHQEQAVLSSETSEDSEGTTSDEDGLDTVDITPVKDTSCQTSFEKQKLSSRTKKMSPEQTAKKVKTVKYLLGELKALVADQDDSEVLRLISEVEESISLLPVMVGSTNIQAEIALALQPLRSENAQLRRRLRIVNQQLKERERAEKESRSSDCNFEIISLQSMNMTLQSKLQESQKGFEALQKRNEELVQIIEVQRQEKSLLLKTIENKDKELQERRQTCEVDTARVKMDVDEALSQMKSFQFKLEASEKENHVLAVSLQQRDAEISRLRDLTRSLQERMARLVSELNLEKNVPKTSTHLTKTLLDCYDYQQKASSASDSVSNAINMYLKTLEANQHCFLQEGMPTFCDSKENGGLSTWRIGDSFGNPEENSSPVKACMTTPLSENGVSLGSNREAELDKTTYIPLKETVKKQQYSSDAPKMPSAHCSSNKKPYDSKRNPSDDIVQCVEPKQLDCAFEKLHISKDPLSYRGDSLQSPGKSSNTPSSDTDGALLRPLGRTDTVAGGSNNHFQHFVPCDENRGQVFNRRSSTFNSTFSSFDIRAVASDWSMSSVSTFNTQDEQEFRNGLAALDASIASLQKTIQSDLKR
ncbi:CCD14 protein, partial [Atractosteus spatula]|nr:CCD14 protein [Atractosteus spatula]